MTDRYIGRDAVHDNTTDQTHAVTYLPGTPESAMPAAFVATLGDHVWAEVDETGRPVLTPIGGLDQLTGSAHRQSTYAPEIAPDAPYATAARHAEPEVRQALKVEDVPTRTPERADEPEVETEESLAELGKPALVEICKDRGLSHSGTAAELIARILDPEDD